MKYIFFILICAFSAAQIVTGSTGSSAHRGRTVLIAPTATAQARPHSPSASPRWKSPRTHPSHPDFDQYAAVSGSRPPSALAMRRKGESPHLDPKRLAQKNSSGASTSPASQTVIGLSPSSGASHDASGTPRTPVFKGIVAAAPRVTPDDIGKGSRKRLEELIESDMPPAAHPVHAAHQRTADVPGHIAHMSGDLTSLAGLRSVMASGRVPRTAADHKGEKEDAEAEKYVRRRQHQRIASMSTIFASKRGSFIAALNREKKKALKPKLPFIAHTALKDERGDVALNLACDALDFRSVLFLIQKLDACPNVRDQQQRTPLMAICESYSNKDEDIQESLKIFDLLIAQPHIDIVAQNSYEKTARQLALTQKRSADDSGYKKLVQAKEYMIKKLDELFFKQREANKKFVAKDKEQEKRKNAKTQKLEAYLRDESLDEPQHGCCG